MTIVRTPRAFAAPGCVLLTDCSRVQGDSDIQRRGEFDPRWFCKALMDVAFFLYLVAAAGGVQAQAVAPSTPPTVAQRFDAALEAYERNHWVEAHAPLSALADAGHPEAARMALQMRQYGPALYGRELLASAGQVAQWKRRLGCGDVTVAGCQQALATPRTSPRFDSSPGAMQGGLRALCIASAALWLTGNLSLTNRKQR